MIGNDYGKATKERYLNFRESFILSRYTRAVKSKFINVNIWEQIRFYFIFIDYLLTT